MKRTITRILLRRALAIGTLVFVLIAAGAVALADDGALAGNRHRVLVSTDIGGTDPDESLVQCKRAAARGVTQGEMDAHPLPVKLRDGFARLFAPHL